MGSKGNKKCPLSLLVGIFPVAVVCFPFFGVKQIRRFLAFTWTLKSRNLQADSAWLLVALGELTLQHDLDEGKAASRAENGQLQPSHRCPFWVSLAEYMDSTELSLVPFILTLVFQKDTWGP